MVYIQEMGPCSGSHGWQAVGGGAGAEGQAQAAAASASCFQKAGRGL